MTRAKFKFLSLIVSALLVVSLITSADAAIIKSINRIDFEKLYVTGGNSGVLVSYNEGSNWFEIGPNLSVNDLVVDNDNLFAATNQGIYRKLSGGSWSLISPSNWSTNLISKNNNYFLAAVGSKIRLTSNPEAPSVFWSLANIILPAQHSIGKFKQLETIGNYAYAIAEGTKCSQKDNGTVCSFFNFYFGSNDSGQNWFLLDQIIFKDQFHSCLTIDANNPAIYAHGGYDGLKVKNWNQQLAYEDRWAVMDCRFVGQNLVIGSFDAFYGAKIGLQYSPDRGQSWYQSGLINRVVYKVAQNKVNDAFYAIGQRVWNSSDLKLYKLNLSNIVKIKDYQYSKPQEMIFTTWIP